MSGSIREGSQSKKTGVVPDRFTTTQERLVDGRWRVQHDAAEPAEADSLLDAYARALTNLARQSGKTGGAR